MSQPGHHLLDLTVTPTRIPREDLESRAAHGEAPLLLMCLVQITGDSSYLDRFGPKITFAATADIRLLPAGELPAEDRRELVNLLATALDSDEQNDYLQVPDDGLFQRMMQFATGTTVGDEFIGILKEQAGFKLRESTIERTTLPATGFKTIILGAGMTGIAASIALTDSGFEHEILEAGDDIGGTWRVNTYPGIAVDTPSVYYSFSFELESNWSKVFPIGGEYQEYLRRVVDKYDVKQHIRFNTRITSLTWDESASEWVIEAVSDGVTVTTRANAVITAAGFLNRPQIPNLPGLDSFRGDTVHTAAWNPELDLRGKRVAVVGAGATSVQVVDAIIGEVEHLTLFQRQPHWVMPNHLGEGLVSDEEQWLLRNVPFYDRWQRARTYWFVSDGNYPAVRADPEWIKTHELSISEANDRYLQMCQAHLNASFRHDPELLAKMTPDFAPHGKRIIRDPGGFYAALASDKASVVTDPLVSIEPEGIRTADGTLVELDVIIWATGFTLDFLSTVDITGRDGVTLAEQWVDNDPRAYMGGTVPNFPNLFITSAPNTSAGHGGGHNFMTEVVVHYISECLQLLVERKAKTIEVTAPTLDEFIAVVDEAMEGSVWRTATGAHTYYRNAAGRVILPNPWRMVDYWQMHRTPDESKFILS